MAVNLFHRTCQNKVTAGVYFIENSVVMFILMKRLK